MKYRLGLDLGIGSIGSAVIELDENNNPKDIVDSGVRIFEVSEGSEERRLKRTARKNLIRRRKRLELLAHKLFENGLWITETPEGTSKLQSRSPYEIRNSALYGKLASPFYVGRAILHLAKHRGAGYVSASEEQEDEIFEEGMSGKNKKSPYDMMLHHLKTSNSQTIGEFFYKRLQEGYEKDENNQLISPNKRIIRQKKDFLNGTVDYAIPRYLVKDEFNQIWDKQAQYFSQMQKTGLKEEISNILFYERPPLPYATGKCIYYRDEDRLLKAHPLFEMRRIYEEVNNIYITEGLKHRRLTLQERDKIINEALLKGKNVGKKKIKEVLNLNAHTQISLIDDKVIKCYLYSKEEFSNNKYIRELSEEQLSEFVEFIANPVNPDDKLGRLYSEDELINKLKPILCIEDEKIIGNILTMLPKGRGMIGLSASKKIIEKLKTQVISLREATDSLKLEDSHFEDKELSGSRDFLPYYGEILQTDTQPLPPHISAYKKQLSSTLSSKEANYLMDEINFGKIANPAVHMILNQIRLVVNEIIKIYGKPYDINIELGRDVGLSTKKKNELEKKQKANEKFNNEAISYLKENRFSVNRTNILKYKLWKEQAHICPYCLDEIAASNFLHCEIEHIIPQAKGGSDTYNNVCLVHSNCNHSKGDMFAYDYFEKNYKNEKIAKILENARKRLPDKAWRFEADAREKYEDYGDVEATDRRLTDTRYVSKMAARYLRAIVDDDGSHSRILPVRGAQTAELRKRWNLLGIEYDLMGLDVPRYLPCSPYWFEKNTGEVIEGSQKPDIGGEWELRNKKKNPEWVAKPRIDHRHHAMDAITVACANRSLIQKMSNEINIKQLQVPSPLTSLSHFSEFRDKVIGVLRNINVSHKAEHSKLGQMHKETGRKVLCQNPEDNNALITVYVGDILQNIKSFNNLDKLLVSPSIKDEYHSDIAEDRRKQLELKQNIEKYADIAEQILIKENEKAIGDGKKEIKITETRILAKAFRLVQEKKLWKGRSFKCYENNSSLVYIPKHKLAYEGRNNYCIDFYQKDGKVGWEVIKCFDINQKDFVPQWKKEGAKIIWSLQQGDILELDTPDEWRNYTSKGRCFAKVKKFSSGKIALDYVTDARATAKAKDAPDYLLVNSLSDRGLSYLTKRQARKVNLTPFGKIKHKHKILWDGKKAA